MKALYLIFLALILSSCSTLKKSIIYPSVGGLIIGAAGGHTLSDEEKGHSKTGNAAIYGGIGALVGAGLGYLLYKDHPDNKKLQHALNIEDEIKNMPKASEYPELKNRKLNGYFKLPIQSSGHIPSELMHKLKSPTVKVYEIPSKVIERDGKQIVIEKTKGYEYVLE